MPKYAYQDIYEPEEGNYGYVSGADVSPIVAKPKPITTIDKPIQGGVSTTIFHPGGKTTQTWTAASPTIGVNMLAKLLQIGYTSSKSNAIIAIANAAKTTGQAFANLPNWVKTGLTFVGIDSLIDWVVEDTTAVAPLNTTDWILDPDENALVWDPGSFAIAQTQRGQPMMTTTRPAPFRIGQPFQNGLMVLKTWIANGMVHLKLSNGYRAVQKLDGEWKIWRPKRIKAVLYSDGAKNLSTTILAGKIIKKEAKKMKKLVDFFYPPKSTKKVPANVINVETGAGSLIAK